MQNLLRVLVNDSSWATIQATDSSTVQELIAALKRQHVTNCLDSFMTLCYCDNGCKTERILSPQEAPMKLISPLDRQTTQTSPFIRFVVPEMATMEKQRFVSEFCGFADVRAHRKDLWTPRWISLKEQSLKWSKAPSDKKIRGQIDLSDAYVEADGWNNVHDSPYNKKSTGSFVLKVIKLDRIVKISFGDVHLLSAWLHVLKEHCTSDNANLHFDFVDEDIEQHEFKTWSKHEDQFRSLSTLSTVLECPLAFNVFFLYLKRAHSEEGLIFWLSVKKFKSGQISDKNAGEIAQSIYVKFISEGSECELPLTCKERAFLTSALNERPLRRNVFDHLTDSILKQLEQEKFTDFKKSSYFRSILIRLSMMPRLNDQDCPIPIWEDLSFEDG